VKFSILNYGLWSNLKAHHFAIRHNQYIGDLPWWDNIANALRDI
jgi:hypothetical protein